MDLLGGYGSDSGSEHEDEITNVNSMSNKPAVVNPAISSSATKPSSSHSSSSASSSSLFRNLPLPRSENFQLTSKQNDVDEPISFFGDLSGKSINHSIDNDDDDDDAGPIPATVARVPVPKKQSAPVGPAPFERAPVIEETRRPVSTLFTLLPKPKSAPTDSKPATLARSKPAPVSSSSSSVLLSSPSVPTPAAVPAIADGGYEGEPANSEVIGTGYDQSAHSAGHDYSAQLYPDPYSYHGYAPDNVELDTAASTVVADGGQQFASDLPPPPQAQQYQSNFVNVPASFKRRRHRETESVEVVDLVPQQHSAPIILAKRPSALDAKPVEAPTYVPSRGVVMGNQPSQTQKRKHQLVWLAAKYTQDRDSLEERAASGLLTKKQAWGKYGW
jgi:hypothetical protein